MHLSSLLPRDNRHSITERMNETPQWDFIEFSPWTPIENRKVNLEKTPLIIWKKGIYLDVTNNKIIPYLTFLTFKNGYSMKTKAL